MNSQVARTFALPSTDKGGLLLDADEVRLLREVSTVVPAGQRILGDPWDGSALVWVFGGREPVFPHLTGTWGPDRDVVATRLGEAGSAPEVCAALDRLRVRYVVADPEKLWGGDPQAAYFSGIDGAVQSGVLVPVRSEGSAALYRIDACGPLR
jgi:hypothetical protein